MGAVESPVVWDEGKCALGRLGSDILYNHLFGRVFVLKVGDIVSEDVTSCAEVPFKGFTQPRRSAPPNYNALASVLRISRLYTDFFLLYTIGLSLITRLPQLSLSRLLTW